MSAYERYIALQKKRHQMLLEGKDCDGPEVDEVECQLTDLWDELTVEERRNANLNGG